MVDQDRSTNRGITGCRGWQRFCAGREHDMNECERGYEEEQLGRERGVHRISCAGLWVAIRHAGQGLFGEEC